MKWLIVFICFMLLCFFIKKNKFFNAGYPGFIPVILIFLLKFLCGLLLGWIYTNYYYGAGDTFSYLYDSNIIHSLMFHHPVQYLEIVTGINADDTPLQAVY